MNGLESLLKCVGHWSGTSRLQEPHAGSPDVSSSTATIVEVCGGRFVRIDYTWAYNGTPQEGSLLVGFDTGAATAHWIDTWHMGNKVMVCGGMIEPSGPITVRGSYAAPPDPTGVGASWLCQKVRNCAW